LLDRISRYRLKSIDCYSELIKRRKLVVKRTAILLLAAVIACVFIGCANESVNRPRESGNTAQPRESVAPTQLLPQEAEMLEAAAKGNTARVQELLDQGVNVNMRGRDGNTPIMEAAYGNHLDTVKLLLDHGADLSAKKRDGATPITLASDKEMVALFKNVTSMVSAASAGNNSILETFLNQGTPINALSESGESALHAACWTGKTDTVKFLLEHGADPQIKKADGATPVTLASGQNHPDIVALLNAAVEKKSKEAAAKGAGTPASSPAKTK
jgi:ankyrin repeat protein